MTATLIWTIVFQVLAIIADIYIAFQNDRRNVLIATFVCNFICFLLYLYIRDFSTAGSYTLIISRSFIYIFQDKLKKYKVSVMIPIGFMLCHIGVGIFTMSSFWHILPIVAPCIVCYLLWLENSRQKMRLEQALSDTIWLTYNLHDGLYLLCLSRLVSIVSGLWAYRINRKNKEVSEAETQS